MQYRYDTLQALSNSMSSFGAYAVATGDALNNSVHQSTLSYSPEDEPVTIQSWVI